MYSPCTPPPAHLPPPQATPEPYVTSWTLELQPLMISGTTSLGTGLDMLVKRIGSATQRP